MEHSKEYFEGQKAAQQGLLDVDNPYRIGSFEALFWQEGFSSKQ